MGLFTPTTKTLDALPEESSQADRASHDLRTKKENWAGDVEGIDSPKYLK